MNHATVGELAPRVSRLNDSMRRVEAPQLCRSYEAGTCLALGVEISYVVKGAKNWEVDPARTASEFDAAYYVWLLEKAWGDSFCFRVC
jgi:hypothetical protein